MIRSTGSNGFEGCASKGEIVTPSGRMFNLLVPKISDADIEDIAHMLANTNRFHGAPPWPYSVAQHSCYGADLAVQRRPKRPDFALRLLLHDAHEAYTGDISLPMKMLLGPLLEQIESRVQNAVWENFFGSAPTDKEHAAIKVIDKALARAEAISWWPASERWNWSGPPAEVNVVEWSWKKARSEFMARYHQLVERME